LAFACFLHLQLLLFTTAPIHQQPCVTHLPHEVVAVASMANVNCGIRTCSPCEEFSSDLSATPERAV
jgi:hypothetical protein